MTLSKISSDWKFSASLAFAVPISTGLFVYYWLRIRQNKNREMESGNEINSSYYFFKIVLKVPNDKVGAMIGREGSVIRQVERDFNVKLKLSKSESPEDNFSVLTIKGSRDCVTAADVHLRKVLAQTSPALLYDMKAPRNLIGMLIGKEGSCIKAMQRESNARITVERLENSDSCKIRIKGSPTALERARGLNETVVFENFGMKKRKIHSLDKTTTENEQ